MGSFGTYNHISKSDYFVAALLFATGGNAIITDFKWHAFVIVFIMAILCATKHIELHYEKLRLFLAAFITLALLQTIMLPIPSVPAYFNFIAKIIAGFLMVSFLGDKFRLAYFRVCTFFCAFALVFWAVFLIHPLEGGLTVGSYKHFLVWCYPTWADSHARNGGMFWEPGAFQGYIMIVPILFIDKLKELWQTEKRSCIIILAALASTTSTTGYVTFFFILGLYILKRVKNIFLKFLIIAAFAAGVFYAVTSLDFLGQKILGQYENAKYLDYRSEGQMRSRMGTQIIDMTLIQRHPIIGNSFNMEAKYDYLADVMMGSGNGFTGMMASAGIPFFLLFLWGLYKAHPAEEKFYKMVATMAVCLLFYGENFYNFIPWWALLFATYRQDDYLLYSQKL